MRKRGVNEFGWGVVCMCVAMYASGCVFSPSFGEVSPEDTTSDQDMRAVMPDSGRVDMMPPGPDMHPPVDMGPDGMAPPPDVDMSCGSESDCMDGITTCISGQCELCANQPVITDVCNPTSDTFLCGRGSMGGNCAIDCMCPDESFVCEPAASSERGTCVPPKGDVCLSEDDITKLCEMGQSCRAVQYTCPIRGLQTSDCDGVRDGVNVCSAVVNPTPGMALSGRHVAMGARHAVVSHGVDDAPELYFKNAAGAWNPVTGLTVDQNKIIDALELLFVSGVQEQTFAVTKHGVAVDISEDDVYMAVTTGISVMLKNGDNQALNIVNVFRRNGTDWAFLGAITPLMDEANSRFGESIALHGTRLLVGAPGAEGAGGALRLYDLGVMADSTPSSFKPEVSCGGSNSQPGVGEQVDFGLIAAGTPVLYTVREELPNMYQVVACTNDIATTFTPVGPVVTGDQQGITMSASNSEVFIRSANQAVIYAMTTDAVSIMSGKAAQYEPIALTNGEPLIVRFVQAASGSVRQVLMNSADTVHIAPPRHVAVPGVNFNAYDTYFPIGVNTNMPRELIAADLNLDGDVIMLVQRGQQATVFFAQVQASP